MEAVRVLQMIGSLDVGGSQTMIINLYKALDREKIQFDFVIDDPNGTHFVELVKSMGARVYVMPKFNGINLMQVKKAWKVFFAEHPEYRILHSHVRSYASIYLPIAKKMGLTTIIHSHSTSNGKGLKAVVKKILQSRIPKYSDYCFACTYNSGKWLFGEKTVKSEKFKVIPNAIDTEKYKFSERIRSEMRQSLELENKIVYGHVGRFHPSKNHAFLLDLYCEIHANQPNSVLLLVGDGELRDEIENRIKELSLTDSVILLGMRSDVHLLMQAMDVFLFPSSWEGLPLTVVEAQASGLPCFVSDRVTKEVCLSGLVKYLPIDSGTKIWTDNVFKDLNARENVVESIKKAGFDVLETANMLTSFYMEHSNG